MSHENTRANAYPRDISLKIQLSGGHVHALTLREDAPELMTLFSALATPQAASVFVQLPLDGGRTACSFQTSQLVSILSEPPVLTAQPPALLRPDLSATSPPPITQRLRRPRHVIVDDFLSPREHQELLAFALLSESRFEPGTVTSYEPATRQNLVVLEFGESVHSKLLENRLLTWLPLLTQQLGIPLFPLGLVESQLTAAGDGHFFKVHCDQAPDLPRALSCVYYMQREPRGFSGGDLRIYDCMETDDTRRPADSFISVEPLANRLVVFASEEFHEAMPVRCPSRSFADSRFAITTWLHRAAQASAEATFGWGHYRCGVVPPAFTSLRVTGSDRT